MTRCQEDPVLRRLVLQYGAGNLLVLREAVLPQNRERFAANLVAFMNEHGLDGIDLDWEYPGVSGSHYYHSPFVHFLATQELDRAPPLRTNMGEWGIGS